MIWIILFLATLLRTVNLNQSLWLDEAAQVLMSQKSLYSIILERSGDFHPPLSYILYHYWMMFGTSEIWLRLLPIIFGVSTVFIIYKLSQKLFSEKIALISATLLATAPYHIYYSEEIRMYSMVAFLASLSMYFLIINRRIGYVLATSALLYTHYMGVFLVISQLLYKRNWQNLTLVSLLYLPWLPFLWNQLVSGVNANQYLPGWGKLLSLDPVKTLPLTFIKFGIGRINFDNLYVYGIVAVVVLTFIGWLLFKAFKGKETQLIWFWLVVPIITAWLISFIIPMNQPFRLLFVLPAFYILLSVGILELGKYWRLGLLGIICISVFGLLVYWINPKFQREDWRTATRNIPTNAIFAWPQPFDPYIWYGGEGMGVVKYFPASQNEVTENLKNAKLGKVVYFFEYLQGLTDPQKIIQQELARLGYQLKETRDFRGVGFVDLYQR